MQYACRSKKKSYSAVDLFLIVVLRAGDDFKGGDDLTVHQGGVEPDETLLQRLLVVPTLEVRVLNIN